MEFRTHNTSWEAVDFDGIKLMRRPLPQTQAEAMDLKPGFSKAAKYQMAQKMAQRTARKPGKNDYTVIDLETTGLHAATDSIVEYGAVRLFPAYAGVIPADFQLNALAEAFPRIRGGDPWKAQQRAGSYCFSPHTRG